MVLIPVFLVVMLSDWPTWIGASGPVAALRPWISAAVFGLLAATDAVDGYLARTRNEVTTFGKFLDPLADKLLVTAALLALVDLNVLPAWIAFVIVAREFIVSGLRMVASAEGLVIAASGYGKLKTVAQIIAIIAFIIKDSSLLLDLGASFQVLIQGLSWTVMGIAVVLTIMSMLDYFRHAAEVLVGPWSFSGVDSSSGADRSAEDGARSESSR
jgi:CDP-diacylglycerol--glycerol-3-phosphate 3-phosphatidyltransferase